MTPPLFEDQLSESITAILQKHMLFAGKALSTPHIIDNSLDTAATDGKAVLYNQDFFDSLTYKQRITLVCHELLHILRADHYRMNNRDSKLWNSATDYVINSILLKMGFEPIDNWLYDSKYDGMSAEDVYKLLQDKSKEEQDQINKQGQNSTGSVNEPAGEDGSPLTDQERSEGIQAAQSDMQKAADMLDRKIKGIEKSDTLTEQSKAEQLKEIGQGFNEFKNRITDFNRSNVDWRSIARQFIFADASSDYADSELDLDEMFIHDYGYIIPNIINEEFGEIALCLDVSGSLYHMAKQVASECFHALEEINRGSLLCYHISTYIHSKEVLTKDSEIQEIRGDGTDFDCFFNKELIENEIPAKAIIFVTDGYVNFNNWIAPEVPVLWILTRANVKFENNVPFGECVRMNS